MKTLLASLLVWISVETDYNVDFPHPTIVSVSQIELEKIYYKGDVAPPGVELHAFYKADTDEIYLSNEWNLYNAFDRGVLLHEVLHYIQDMNNVPYACIGELEKEVWPLQKKYLLEVHGVVWKYDELWYKMTTICH